MSKLKKNLRQFREWARNLVRRRKKPKAIESTPQRTRAAPQKASAVQTLPQQAKAAARQAGRVLHQQGISQGQPVNRNDPPMATPNRHQAKPSSGGSSWKRPMPSYQGKQAKQKKGRSL